MKLVSACLLGIKCNYAGKAWFKKDIHKEFLEGDLFPVCAEVLGGLPSPRLPAEIQGGDGHDVLSGRAKVIAENGDDLTAQFRSGAEKVLETAKALKCTEALLIERSPSCGCGVIFDGTFSFRYKKGDGVTCALLKENGINITPVMVDAKEEDEQMRLFREKEKQNLN